MTGDFLAFFSTSCWGKRVDNARRQRFAKPKTREVIARQRFAKPKNSRSYSSKRGTYTMVRHCAGIITVPQAPVPAQTTAR